MVNLSKAKHPGFSMQVNADSVKEFAVKASKNPYLKNFTIFHFGQTTWERIEKIFKEKM